MIVRESRYMDIPNQFIHPIFKIVKVVFVEGRNKNRIFSNF